MEDRNLEQVKELINRIADHQDLPTDAQIREMRELTGIEWDAEDLQMLCCGYWSHNSLEETAYMMFHEEFPPVLETDLVFWKQKAGAVLDAAAVYEKYRLGKGNLKALEVLPIEQICQKVRAAFQDWDQTVGDEGGYRFDCISQKTYWTDTHFWLFPYGRKAGDQNEIQMIRFSCHNMEEEQMQGIFACMEDFQCSLHIREDYDVEDDPGIDMEDEGDMSFLG